MEMGAITWILSLACNFNSIALSLCMFLPYDFCAFDMLLGPLSNSDLFGWKSILAFTCQELSKPSGHVLMSVIDLTDTSSSEDTEIWNQLCRLYSPSKTILFIWRILFNAHPVRAELRRHIRTEELCPLCQRYTIGHYFFPSTSTSIWFYLSLDINFIQHYSIQAWIKSWLKGIRGNLEYVKYFSVSFVSIVWSMDFLEQVNHEERDFLCH